MAAREGHITTAPAEPAAPPALEVNYPRSFFREESGGLRRDLTPRELAEAVRGGAGQLWVDIDACNRHQLAVLEKIFHFHHLAIEDTLNPESRPKVEEYDGYIFLIVRGVRFEEKTDDPYDLQTFSLYFFLGPNYLVTVHSEPSRAIEMIAMHLARSPEMLARGAQRLMHAIMDVAIDFYFPILHQIDEFIAGLEERVFASFDQEALQEIFSVKRLVLSMRRHLNPQREVFNTLTNRPSALLSHDTQLYFRDIYDHTLRIVDTLESQRDLLSSTLDAYLTQVSNRLGTVTKGLSLIATLSVPFVVVSGMWGMNFEHIPLSANRFGFWLMLVLQLGIGVGLIVLLRWRRWL